MSSYIIGPLSLRRCEPVNSQWSAQKKTAVSSRMPSSRATSSFTNEQWKKLIAVYWGYTAMIFLHCSFVNEEVDQ